MSTFTVLNPATEEPVTTVTQASAEETDQAVARASAALPAWRAVSPGDRARMLRAFAAAVDAASEELAGLEVTGSGHPIGAARWEAGQVRDVLQYYAAAPERLSGKQIPVPGGLNVTFHEPVGVVGLIVPWNFPMPILSWGMAPALAAGGTGVAKPAEATPLTAMRIGSLALEAGLPEGVFRVLPGKGSVVGQRLVDHPAVRKIVFTGSTEVGQRIMADCARQVKRLTLELGGKSANIVFADADLEKAAATAPYAVFDNAGQDCCARSRILVQRSVLDRFMGLFESAVRGVVVGDPASAATEMGPLISAAHRSHVASYVPDGAPVAFRGHAPSGPGYWYPPTVLAPVRPDDPAYTEEVFGPVVTVTPFYDEAEAVAIANDTPYGLSGWRWSRDAAGEKAAAETGGLYVRADVTSETDVAAAFRTAHDTYGSVDVAFNNAGISPPDDDSILDTGMDAWRRVQEVNLISVYLCCKEAIGYMRVQGKGAIVNTASFVAVMGSATSQISYTASKGGVLAMSRELGVQFAREGIRVNALCPGPVNTPLLRELFAADPERAQRRLVHVPMGRFAEPEEIAAAVAFLASDDASFITASTFLVDGGISGAYVTPL